jgi:YidC/Oxa1 family membrane protein insertase
MLELYKKEKVNPISGCLPLLLQMPVFFALYKVLYVTLEMRHAKFYGWINDLSAADPTNIFTLFGLIPWHTPSFLHIGVLPIIMALTLFLQQGLNPQPADPTQAKVMKMLPVIFLFMFASFPSGLVLYWSWSNMLSIAQQVLIKRITK